MLAGEAFWLGRDQTLAGCIDKRIPECLSPKQWFREGFHTDGMRQPLMRRSVMDDFHKRIGPFYMAWRLSMEAEIAATESSDRASTAMERLGSLVQSFRERIKNDMSSMKAASERVQSEVSQMETKYRKAQDLLTSAEFERAIANAERLATALESISKLSETKLSVAVFSGTPGGPSA